MSDDDASQEEYNQYLFTEDGLLSDSLGALNIQKQRKQIRHELTDPYNRLQSIHLDSQFVNTVGAVYPDFPIIPNLRCGAWYVDTKLQKAGQRGVYFKSIDGHAGQWNFSLRRPNLQLIDTIKQFGGVIVVDSTRRGKRFPDALSKTIPTWCAVINRAVHARYPPQREWTDDDLDIHTAHTSVSESERDQIRQRLPRLTQSLLDSSYALHPLEKPLRPLHISPSSSLPSEALRASSFQSLYPVVCLSASRYTSGGSSERHGSFNYVPGSGDDHEGWAPQGFETNLFWKYENEILASSRDDLEHLLLDIVQREAQQAEPSNQSSHVSRIGLTGVSYSFSRLLNDKATNGIYEICLSREGTPQQDRSRQCYLEVPQGPRKHFAYFTEIISHLSNTISAHLRERQEIQLSWSVAEPSANERDIGVAIMLVALALNYDDSQAALITGSGNQMSKALIARRLQWIITASYGRLNPSRKMLQHVNSFLTSL